jgi:hypothetical protein
MRCYIKGGEKGEERKKRKKRKKRKLGKIAVKFKDNFQIKHKLYRFLDVIF